MRDQEIGVSLVTPIEIQKLQRVLHFKAKGSGMGRSIRLAAASGRPCRPHAYMVSWAWFVSGLALPRSRVLTIRECFLRKPDAGNSHVRFDEREVETEYGWDTEAPATERVGNR